jgi:glycogen(starch) synthase
MDLLAWHLTWEFPPHTTGGLGIAVQGLVKALGSRAEVVFPSRDPSARVCGAYGSYYCEGGGQRSVDWELCLDALLAGGSCPEPSVTKALWKFSRDVLARDREGLSIVHGHDWHSILAAVALKRVAGVPFILHFHSTQKERVGRHVEDVITSMERWGIQQADHVVCVSGYSAEHLRRDYGVQPRMCHLIHNASEHKMLPVRAQSRELSLLFAGRMCSQKNPYAALEVIRGVVREYPQAKMFFLGEGNRVRERLRACIDWYQLRAHVVFLESRNSDAMADLYRKVDFLCLPSAAEPFGLVALEATIAGVPVILSEDCGVAERLPSAPMLPAQAVDRWVDTICYLKQNPDRYVKLVRSLQIEAASYTWQDAADKVMALYARCCGLGLTTKASQYWENTEQ